MTMKTASGLAAAAAKQYFRHGNMVNFAIEDDCEDNTSFIDGVVENGEMSDNTYRPVEFSLTPAK